MKRNIVFIICVILCTTSFSQTKAETEEWLKLKLNDLDSREEYYDSQNGYNDYHYSYSYSFSKGNLVVSKSKWVRSKAGNYLNLDSLTESLTYLYNLSTISYIKITVINRHEKSGIYTPFSCLISFDFDGNHNKTPVKVYDNLTNKYFDSSYVYNATFFKSYKDSSLENNMLERIKKALQHLVTLNGGHIIKDLF